MILLIVFAGFAGLIWLSERTKSDAPATFLFRPGWKRLLLAALITWSLPTAYFLTHQYVQHYYLAPSAFGTALLLGLGAFAIELRKPPITNLKGKLPGRTLRIVALALAVAPGAIAIQRSWSNYERPSLERHPPRFVLPPELADGRAWIWADELSGTLWYYARKPAHKLTATNKETRAQVYKFVLDRGEPQYIVGDPNMKSVKDEISQMGGRLELRGEIDGNAYYLIHWPASGPLERTRN